ncbi:purple acid phosphatase family protein [Methanofollis fontis]|uniref:Fibronectin type-III domain-containing protein n=1 Tax=Methanofollis fontis TaxID=2052832 RepID=A0A483CY96_9EURY|nr:metallophosphoesterase family protein [Methanofollis fontis]TAJ44556.1 hypothetical protein CUJ86_04380 [Methanofollis fontis]
MSGCARVTGLVVFLLIIPVAVMGAANTSVVWGPYVTGTTGTGAIVSWKTVDPTVGAVEYLPPGVNAPLVVTDGRCTDLHHVNLTDLTPGTSYTYQVRVNDSPGPDGSFSTFGNGPVKFVVYADTRAQVPLFTQMERHRLVAERIAQEDNLSFVLHCGDFVTFGDDEEEWDDFFMAGAPMLARTTIMPVLGNHEGNRSLYYEIFSMPEWYSFTAGDAHVVVLDSNDWARGRMDEQTDWMMLDLASSNGTPFVAFHHPPFSSNERLWGGDRFIRENWVPIFEEFDVGTVFNGHTHAYEHYSVNETDYFVIPCGGEEFFSLSENKPEGFVTALEHTLAYLRVSVDDEKTLVEVVPVASVSEDNTAIIHMYPPGEVFETVMLPSERCCIGSFPHLIPPLPPFWLPLLHEMVP